MTALRLLHLYAAELGINGDRGNVLALQQRLVWRGLKAEVVTAGAGQSMPEDVDLVHIGSGPRSARDAVLGDLHARTERLQAWAESGVPMIGIGAGFHLLSREIVSIDGRRQAAAGLLPVTIRETTTRTVGEALGMPAVGFRMAGYLNYAVQVERDGATPLLVLDRGPAAAMSTAALADGGPPLEGARRQHTVGTHLHGPVLPMNPALADELMTQALARHGLRLPPTEERTMAVDELARQSRAAIARRLGRPGTEA